MRYGPVRGIYEQVEEALTSMTMQLRSAISADTRVACKVKGKALPYGDPLGRDDGWGREIAAELGSVLLTTLGLAATIEWHLRQFRACTGIPYELTVNVADGLDLPEEHATAIFRIYGEAMSNVARHAQASHVAITLTISPLGVNLTVRDNGTGLIVQDIRFSRGGIARMRDCAKTLNGLCELAAAPDAGTTVTAGLPIQRD